MKKLRIEESKREKESKTKKRYGEDAERAEEAQIEAERTDSVAKTSLEITTGDSALYPTKT